MIANYLMNLGILIGIYAILAVSLNLALGYAGLLNLGHVGFFAIGAYTSAILVSTGLPYLAALILAGSSAAFAGLFLISVSRKIKGDYLALTTLGFTFVIYAAIINWVSLTNGPMGISGIAKPCIFGLCANNSQNYLLLVTIIATISVLLITLLLRSKFGLLLQATRDDELGLMVLGYDTSKIKMIAMMISAFFAGIAGSLFAHYISFIDPSSFYIGDIILIVSIVIVGGIASIRGSVIATFIIFAIPETIRFVSMPGYMIGPVRQILYSLVLIMVLLYRPRGLFGRIDLE